MMMLGIIFNRFHIDKTFNYMCSYVHRLMMICYFRDMRTCFRNNVPQTSVNHSILFVGDSRVRFQFGVLDKAISKRVIAWSENWQNRRFDDQQMNFTMVSFSSIAIMHCVTYGSELFFFFVIKYEG